MRIQFLPAEQQKRNDTATEKLRRIGYLLFVLLMATIGLGAKLYLWPPTAQSGPQLTGDDGKTIYSVAIVVAPDLILTPAEIGESGWFIAPGERRAARKIGSTTLPDGTEVTLLRLESRTLVPPVAITVPAIGDALVASADGQEWRGAVRSKLADGYSVDPDFALSSGTAVYRDSDRSSLVGFGTHSSSGASLVAAQDIVSHFPELKEGR